MACKESVTENVVHNDAQIPSINIDKVKIIHVKKLKVGSSREEKNVTSIVQLPDKTVIIASCDLSNNRGTLYSISSDGMTRSFKCKQAPYGMTYFDESVHVSYPKKQTIDILYSDLKFWYTFAQGYEFRGLSSNETDIVSISKFKGFSFMNKSGNIYKEFPLKSTNGIDFIHFNKENIYFANDTDQRITCINTAGKMVWRRRFSNKYHDFLEPGGICTDLYGNVFLADTWHGKIFVVAADGSKYRHHSVDEVKEPTAICFDKENCQLIVADKTGSPSIYQVTYR